MIANIFDYHRVIMRRMNISNNFWLKTSTAWSTWAGCGIPVEEILYRGVLRISSSNWVRLTMFQHMQRKITHIIPCIPIPSGAQLKSMLICTMFQSHTIIFSLRGPHIEKGWENSAGDWDVHRIVILLTEWELDLPDIVKKDGVSLKSFWIKRTYDIMRCTSMCNLRVYATHDRGISSSISSILLMRKRRQLAQGQARCLADSLSDE